MNYEKSGGVPKEDEIIQALAKAFDAPEAAAITWLAAISTRFNARAAQERLVERSGVWGGVSHKRGDQ